MEMIPSPRLGFPQRVFLANHLASNDNLTRTTKKQNTNQRKITIHKRALISNNKLMHAKNKTKTRPRLVALYDIRLGNGTALFLQPMEPARA